MKLTLLSRNVVVLTCFVMCGCVGFVMCGCSGNMCTCIYCVLRTWRLHQRINEIEFVILYCGCFNLFCNV